MRLTLKRTKQCDHCPWRKDVCVDDIPGYVPELHPALKSTIAGPMDWTGAYSNRLNIMACHESSIGEETPCIGWVVNQIGPGNNIPLRIAMLTCPENNEIETVGEQHTRFEDTVPDRHNSEA
jgi:Family of unknown function (DUF6283)